MCPVEAVAREWLDTRYQAHFLSWHSSPWAHVLLVLAEVPVTEHRDAAEFLFLRLGVDRAGLDDDDVVDAYGIMQHVGLVPRVAVR